MWEPQVKFDEYYERWVARAYNPETGDKSNCYYSGYRYYWYAVLMARVEANSENRRERKVEKRMRKAALKGDGSEWIDLSRNG